MKSFNYLFSIFLTFFIFGLISCNKESYLEDDNPIESIEAPKSASATSEVKEAITLNKQFQLDKIASKDYLKKVLSAYKKVTIVTTNGNWLRNIYLPEVGDLTRTFILQVNSSSPVNLHIVNGKIITVQPGEKVILTHVVNWNLSSIELLYQSQIGRLGNAKNLNSYFNSYNNVRVVTTNGNWIRNIYLPNDTQSGAGFHITVNSNENVNIHFNGKQITLRTGDRAVFSYSDQEKWQGTMVILSRQSSIGRLKSTQGSKNYFNDFKTVKVITTDHNWISHMYLPNVNQSDRRFELEVKSSSPVYVHIDEVIVRINSRQSLSLNYQNNEWIIENAAKEIAISEQWHINTIKTAKGIKEYLDNFEKVNVVTTNGNWIKDIYLPNSTEAGRQFYITVNSNEPVNVHIGEKTMIVRKRENAHFMYNNNKWSTMVIVSPYELFGVSLPIVTKDYLNMFETLKVITYNGRWIDNITLPKDTHNARKFILQVNSTSPVYLNINGAKVKVNPKEHWTLERRNDRWAAFTGVPQELNISQQWQISPLSNSTSMKALFDLFPKKIKVTTSNDNWIPTIDLPNGVNIGQEFHLIVKSNEPVTIKQNGQTNIGTFQKGQEVKLIYYDGKWDTEQQLKTLICPPNSDDMKFTPYNTIPNSNKNRNIGIRQSIKNELKKRKKRQVNNQLFETLDGKQVLETVSHGKSRVKREISNVELFQIIEKLRELRALFFGLTQYFHDVFDFADAPQAPMILNAISRFMSELSSFLDNFEIPDDQESFHLALDHIEDLFYTLIDSNLPGDHDDQIENDNVLLFEIGQYLNFDFHFLPVQDMSNALANIIDVVSNFVHSDYGYQQYVSETSSFAQSHGYCSQSQSH